VVRNKSPQRRNWQKVFPFALLGKNQPSCGFAQLSARLVKVGRPAIDS
jgi:hypothetical protein